MSQKYPTKLEIEAARELAEHTAKVLKANEILWRDDWNKAANPWIAINTYRSAKQRAIRKPITDAMLNAKAAYLAIKPKGRDG
jgi:hypothetical protein